MQGPIRTPEQTIIAQHPSCSQLCKKRVHFPEKTF